MTEAAAGELTLHGELQTIMIASTAGVEVTKCSRQIELTVANIESEFTAKREANVLNKIISDTQAIEWSELTTKWPT